MNTKFDDLPLLSRLLDELLGLQPERVEAWLAALPAEHAHLQPRLRRMLALQHSQGHAAFLARGPRLAGDVADATVAAPGDLVGPYRLIREIGRGGMGAVWLAERADGALERQVALKLPRLAWGARLAERMARERDIAALLEHPHIARLYDAGVDDRARPYLALEYVAGRPVDTWCREQALTVPQRLRLFLQVARAVAYAHGRLVVHRDLKPSNVLVTADGQAHLLDFGIAKRLDETASDAAPLTQDRDRLLTPHYASPEQLRGGPITIATDVYSLGVLLFEMLTGRLPHEPARRSLAALEQAKLDDEAPPASSRTAEPRTAKALRGELDAILAKALKRNAGERYATVDALADDIERHLAGERVLAQPDSLGYRLVKTVRRHRVGCAAAGAVLLAVLGGAALSVVQASRARDAAERARTVTEFVLDLLRVNEHGVASHAGLRELPMELLLERGGTLIESRLAQQPLLQAELYGVVGGLYAGIGDGEAAARYALRQLESQVAAGASSAQQAQSTLLLARALLAQHRLAEAASMAENALALAGADAQLQAKVQLLRAHVLLRQGRADDAARALDAAERLPTGAARPSADAARARSMRAMLLIGAGREAEARPLATSAVDEAIAAEGALSPTAVELRLLLAGRWTLRGRDDEARPLREAALAALRSSGGAGLVRAAVEVSDTDSALFLEGRIGYAAAAAALERDRAALLARAPLVPARIGAIIDFNLARVYLEAGDLRRADPLLRGSAALLGQPSASLRERGVMAEVQAVAAMLAGRHDEADRGFLEAFELLRQVGAASDSDRVADAVRRAANRSMQQRHDEAEAILAAALPFAGKAGPDGERLAHARARVALDRGQAAAALALLGAPDAPNRAPSLGDLPLLDALLLRGEALCGLGRHDPGLALLDRALHSRQGHEDEHSPLRARTRGVAGLCALAAGQRQRAAELAAQARAALRAQPQASPYLGQPVRQLEEALVAKGPGG